MTSKVSLFYLIHVPTVSGLKLNHFRKTDVHKDFERLFCKLEEHLMSEVILQHANADWTSLCQSRKRKIVQVVLNDTPLLSFSMQKTKFVTIW